ncbi:low molecular weight protein arginine phosphatase [Paenibacillus sediminis]|uniref:Protein-tyrosine phosphatase n=1 Tax=Paenibacillus sediminis TaxID=664909 RepID=A0ABS4H2G3_9BACL|nr:protein-tyrosine phosphatase [Paenibacillus sediminis]
MKRILFVCTGNTCRSPMAEALLRKMALERGLDIEVRSAGVAANSGSSISYHAAAVLRDHQIEDKLTSTQVSSELIDWADLILPMTESHKQHLVRQYPKSMGKTYTLKEYVEDDEEVLKDMKELDSLYAVLEMKRSLGQSLDDEERQKLIEIAQRMPSFDISDPYGGSREDYEVTAAEISAALHKLLDKLS